MKNECEKALKERRQPNCPYCRKPLDIVEYRTKYLHWKWNAMEKEYEKKETGDLGGLFCANCETSDWDFMVRGPEVQTLCKKLGLDY